MSFYRSLSASDLKDDNIINRIYVKYHARLQRYLINQQISREDADDVTQEVYLRLIRHKNRNELKPSWSYLRKITSNLLKDRFRRQRFRETNAHISLSDIEVASSLASPEQTAGSKESIEKFYSVMKSLNEDCKTVFALSRFGGLTYDEIAQKTGISIYMVRKHISYVLKQLRKKIER